MLNYFNDFNVFKRGRKILEIIDVSYNGACMATPKEEYFTEMLHSILEHNHRHGKHYPVKSFEKQLSESWKMKKYAKGNVNNFTTDNLFHPPVNINAQKKDSNMTYERRMALGILAETMK